MNISDYRFTLDLASEISQVSLPVRLLDTHRRFHISLRDGGSPFFMPDGYLAMLEIKRPTGTKLQSFCRIERNSVVVYDFSENEGTAAVPGVHNCDLVIYSPEGAHVASPKFTMVVSERVVSYDDVDVSDEDMVILDAMISAEAERQAAEGKRAEAEKVREALIGGLRDQKFGDLAPGEESGSLKLGESARAISEGSVAFGTNSFAGCRGYYWNNIDFESRSLVLSTSQLEVVPPVNFTWEIGDKVNITNDEKYIECSEITAISVAADGGITITVDSLPFTKIVDPDNFGEEDRGICVPEKPDEGEVKFGWHSYSFGMENKVVGKRAFAAGYYNRIFGDFGCALGSQNKAGYIADAIGCKNTVMGKAAFGCGHGNTVSGKYGFAANNANTAAHECSSAHGLGNHTNRAYQFVTGKYNDDSDGIFVVGNGTSTVPKNIFELYDDGGIKAGGKHTAQEFLAIPDYGELVYHCRNKKEFNTFSKNFKPSQGTVTWENGMFTYRTTSTNNWVQKSVAAGFADGSEYKFVKIRYRTSLNALEGEHAPYASLFWRTVNVGGDNAVDPLDDGEHEVVTIGTRQKLQLITDNKWHDVVYDLSSHSKWDDGTITLLRWQFSEVIEGDIHIEQFGLFKTAEEAYASVPSISLLELYKILKTGGVI